MKQKSARFMLTVCLFAGLMVFPAQADLNLTQVLAESGLAAVGQTVRVAVEDIYASTDDSQSIQDQIVEIINEAVATGNGEAVRYSLIAVMMAGGAENLGLSKLAIDNSAAFTSFPDITAVTVTTATSLIAAMGGDYTTGGAGTDSGGGAADLGGGATDLGGGAEEMELGGGADDDPFDDGDDAMTDDGDAEVNDGDVVPTPV